MKTKNRYQDLVQIIIPTYNRNDSLKRVLDYYLETGKEFNFIIADSSSPKNKIRNKKLIKSYQELKILYKDNFSENLQQHLKFSRMVKYVSAKYCVFCPDDDFIVPNGIKEAVEFLERNPDYSAAHGIYVGFHLFKGPMNFKSFWWNFRYKNQSLQERSSSKRLTSYLKNLNLVMWSVRRTEMLKAAYSKLSKANFDPHLLLMYGELLPDSLTVINGKVKRLSTLYAARQYFASIAANYSTLNDALNTEIYEREYAKFKNLLTKGLMEKDGISKNDANIIVDSATQKYLKYSYQEYLINKINRKLGKIPLLQKIFKLLHATYLLSKDKKSALGVIDKPSSKYFSNFNKIKELVLESSI